jgi:polar amino acid transport system substrate-binding protein
MSTLVRALCVSAAFLAMSSGASADTLDNIKAAKKIRVAIDLALPPFGMLDEKKQATGADVETARMLAKDLGVDLEIVSVTTPNRIPFLQTNKADIIISTLSITPERQKVIDFSHPYSVLPQVVAAPSNMPVKSYADLTGKKVATTRGSQGDVVFTQNMKDAQILRFDDDAIAVQAVISGQADTIANSASVIKTLQEKAPGRNIEVKFVMQNYNLGMGVRKNEPKLVEWLDNWTKTNLKNGRLNAVYKKFLDRDLPQELLKTAD